MNRNKLHEALGMIGSAAQVRADQWAGAAENGQDIGNLFDELYEADSDECKNMANIIHDSLRLVRNTGGLYSNDEGTTAMCMWEWFNQTTEVSREHYKHEEGACSTRNDFLQHAHVLDEAWSIANKEYDYSDCFDWNFVPRFMESAIQLDLDTCQFSDHITEILDAMGVTEPECATMALRKLEEKVAAKLAPYAKYGWQITDDYITPKLSNDLGSVDFPELDDPRPTAENLLGPRNIAPEAREALADGGGEVFRMKDDDNEIYFKGRIVGDYDGFEPLDDYGTPGCGCVHIEYWDSKKVEWRPL